MTEDGISRLCHNCNKSFLTTDGDYFCSSECFDHWDSVQEEEEED